MKKLILLLLIVIATNVNAKEIYTDYEFKEYTPIQQKNDELNKYEPVLINKFYKLEETDYEYLEEDFDGEYEYKDENDFKYETITSNIKSPIFNNENLITIGANYNYMTNPVIFKNIKDFNKIDIKEIEIYTDNRLLATEVTGATGVNDKNFDTPINLTSDTLSIKTKYINYWIENIKIVIHYGNQIPINFTLNLKPTSGLYTLEKSITLDNTLNKVTINFLQNEKFNDFIKSKNLDVKDNMANYYSYQKKLYKYYNMKKVYYMESELDKIEGYTFDKDESIKMYKHYQREKKTVQEEIVNDSKIDDVIKEEQPPILNNIVKEQLIIKKHLPKNTKALTEKKSKIEEQYNEPSETSSKDETLVEENKNIETLTKQDNYNESTTCKSKPSIWFILSIIFLLISIILEYLHYKDVKRKRE